MNDGRASVKVDLSEHSVSLNLPFPPTLNHNVGVNNRRRYRTKAYKAFVEEVGWLWKVATMHFLSMRRSWSDENLYDVTVWLAYNSRRRWDEDNRVKPLFDALTLAGVWKDDSQVVSHVVKKFQPVQGDARCYVKIKILYGDAPEIPDFCDF